MKDARNTSAFPWIHDWRSPVASMADAGGELHDIGFSPITPACVPRRRGGAVELGSALEAQVPCPSFPPLPA
ncbi:hypothetical protein HaLaN_29475 [Haematococcus lacustris]|uniref:Uncharacterized protein n=1 Tax=Haematococcus lacustris TaxID=44745 RepID=A0A6A0ADE0_HAELA|nr:hypothetical protein HaLaN_29475 [Haematococcus lacustris]